MFIVGGAVRLSPPPVNLQAMTRRLFLDWTRPLLPQAAERLVAHYADVGGASDEARMIGAVVVVPGARAGRRLKELLLEAAEARGLRLVPPRVVTQGTLPELLYEAESPVVSGPVRRLVWAAALRDTAADPSGRRDLNRVFAALPGSERWVARPGGGGAGSLAEWAPLARELAHLARAVGAGGFRFREVADRCGGSLLHDDARRWRALARVQDRVEDRLRELGRRDPDLSRIRALEQGTVRLPGDVWLVAVAEVPGVLRRMLEACAGGSLHAMIHAPAQEADGFDGLGLIRPSQWIPRQVPVPEDRVRIVDRPWHQADAVVEILAGLEGQRTAEEIALGVPSQDVVPALEQRLPRAGVPVRDAAGMALAASGPFRLLSAAADFLAERRFEAFASLVRHPDMAPALAAPHEGDVLPEDWLTHLDRWYGRHLPAVLVRESVAGASGTGDRVVRALAARVTWMLSPLDRDDALLGAWVEPVLRFLAEVYGHHELDPGRERHRQMARALEEIRWTAEALARLPASLEETCTAPAAIRFLLDEAASVRMPAPARDEAVEMLGWLELHLDDAPVTVITGVNEGALPESVRGDPFLPDALRGLLGLEDNRQRYARDAYRMTAILHSREELHLVAGRRNAQGDPLRPPRLLFAQDDETVVRRVERFYGDGGAESGAEGNDSSPTVPGSSGFDLPPEPVIAVDPFPEKISVTDFRILIADPYEWALKKLRRLESLSDQAMELDGAEFGTLAHDVLQAFGRREVERHEAGSVEADPRRIMEELEELLGREVASRFGRGAGWARVAVRLQVEQLRSRLRAFADWHARWVADGWRMKAAEVGTSGDGGVPFPYREDRPPVKLRARIDRVDHHPQGGEWAVFDYKTSDSGDPPEKVHRKGRKEEDKEWVDLQLPLYHWLATRLEGPGGGPLIPVQEASSVRVGYIVLPRDLGGVGDRLADWSPRILESGVERARELLRELSEGPVTFKRDKRPRYPDEEMEALLGRSVLVAETVDDGGDET